MSERKHTPGPWTVRENYGLLWIAAGKGRKATQVADVTNIETGVGSGEVDTDVLTTAANAALLAAAPDLLAACEEALAYYRQTENCGICARENDDHEDACPVPALLAAVAKAKGD